MVVSPDVRRYKAKAKGSGRTDWGPTEAGVVAHTGAQDSCLLYHPRSAETTRGEDKLFFAQKFPRVARIV